MDLKVLVIGKSGVGKTSLIHQFTEGTFDPNLKSSIGADFSLKTVPWNETTNVTVKLFDIAGQESFSPMTRVFYKGAQACIIVCDRFDPNPADAVLSRKRDLDEKVTSPDGSPIPCLLLTNKCDLPGVPPVSAADLDRLTAENGFVGWREVSAKTGKGVANAMLFLVGEAIKKISTITGETLAPGKPTTPFRLQYTPESQGCC
eukprot:m.45923 g.45923  ORF g.45923 m.45923 type:complete len:203 (+) comp11058_c0_seq2:115-723(+)